MARCPLCRRQDAKVREIVSCSVTDLRLLPVSYIGTDSELDRRSHWFKLGSASGHVHRTLLVPSHEGHNKIPLGGTLTDSDSGTLARASCRRQRGHHAIGHPIGRGHGPYAWGDGRGNGMPDGKGTEPDEKAVGKADGMMGVPMASQMG